MASNSNSTTLTSSLGNKATLTASFVETSTNINTNTSDITATASIRMTSGAFSGSRSTYLNIYWHNSVNNTTTLLATLQVPALASATTSVSGSITVQHASDGTASGYAYAEWKNGGTVGYVPREGSVATGNTPLTTIPRASTITAVDANIESATNISINKADPSFTTTLTYSFAGTTGTALTGTIVTKTPNSSYGWTVPSSFYAKIPNSKTGTCTITATTYSGDNSIGTSTTTFTVTASEVICRPTGTISVVDSNSTTTALTGDDNKIVKGVSNATCTITRSAKNSATISSVKINGNNVGTSATTYTINKTTTNVFNLVITDSRGYSTTVTTTKTLVNYIPLTAKATFTRNTATDGKVNLKYDGNYFNNSFGTTNNTLTVQYRYKNNSASSWSSWVTLTATKSGNTYSQEVQLAEDYPYTNAFDFELRVRDKLNTVVVSATVSKGIPVYWWNKDSFNIEVDTYIKGAPIPTLDLFYPVGSIYMSVNSVNPGQLFGGTWVRITDKFLLASGTNYPAGSTGGSATHKLTVNEMPSHTHKLKMRNNGKWEWNSGAESGDKLEGGYHWDGSNVTYNWLIENEPIGGNQSFSTMPPYLAVYCFQRTA